MTVQQRLSVAPVGLPMIVSDSSVRLDHNPRLLFSLALVKLRQ